MTTNTIETVEEVSVLPFGQWVIAADNTVACLFDTHVGFPQRMWGVLTSSGGIRSFVALEQLKFPLALADAIMKPGQTCKHRSANECGQCLRCGTPEVSTRHELHFSLEGMKLFRDVAATNSPGVPDVLDAPRPHCPDHHRLTIPKEDAS